MGARHGGTRMMSAPLSMCTGKQSCRESRPSRLFVAHAVHSPFAKLRKEFLAGCGQMRRSNATLSKWLTARLQHHNAEVQAHSQVAFQLSACPSVCTTSRHAGCLRAQLVMHIGVDAAASAQIYTQLHKTRHALWAVSWAPVSRMRTVCLRWSARSCRGNLVWSLQTGGHICYCCYLHRTYLLAM
eukprot:1153150-Pelagomonas_calceolata.AAC.4